MQRLPEHDLDLRPPAFRPVLAVRHCLARAHNPNRYAGHVSADAEGGRPGLERSHLACPRSSALREEQQRYTLIQQTGRHTFPTTEARAIDGECVEEQRRQSPAPPDVEEVVRRRSCSDIAGESAGE